jgi:hypothetical protein
VPEFLGFHPAILLSQPRLQIVLSGSRIDRISVLNLGLGLPDHRRPGDDFVQRPSNVFSLASRQAATEALSAQMVVFPPEIPTRQSP